VKEKVSHERGNLGIWKCFCWTKMTLTLRTTLGPTTRSELSLGFFNAKQMCYPRSPKKMFYPLTRGYMIT
jgi:hypothetical protein